MKFNGRKRQCLVGAQFIGASPIYRPGKPIEEPLADKSAPTEYPILVVKLYYQRGARYIGPYNWLLHPSQNFHV
jgi:hypothetical protein